MSVQTLKDPHNNAIGYIETEPDGRQVLKDTENNIKGYYDPETDHTRDADYNIVAKGNLLSTLIC